MKESCEEKLRKLMLKDVQKNRHIKNLEANGAKKDKKILELRYELDVVKKTLDRVSLLKLSRGEENDKYVIFVVGFVIGVLSIVVVLGTMGCLG